MMSTPSSSPRACFSRSVPPYTVIIFKPESPCSCVISSATCCASSRVGAKSSDWSVPVASQDSKIGKPNAAVFPEPVRA